MAEEKQCGACWLAEERDDKQAAFHQHLLLLGQSIGKHRHLVLVPRFIHFCDQLPERGHILCQRCNDLGDILMSSHHYKLQLAQMVVGRCLECRTDDLSQDPVVYFTARKVAVCTPFFQYFIKIHPAIFNKLDISFCHCKGSTLYCSIFAL